MSEEKNEMPQADLERARKAAVAVYIATEKIVADDLSAILLGLILEIEWHRRSPPSPSVGRDELVVLLRRASEETPGDDPWGHLYGLAGDALAGMGDLGSPQAGLGGPSSTPSDAWRPLNPSVSLGYHAVRNSDDPDILALQRRMSFSEIHALVEYISRVLIASCNPPPDAIPVYTAEGASSVSPEAQSAGGTTPSPPSEGGDK